MSVIRYTDRDNVVTCLKEYRKGDKLNIDGIEIPVLEDIRIFHKVAIRPIMLHGEVIKYGEVIGHATSEIRAGQWVHVHNIESMRARGDRKDGER